MSFRLYNPKKVINYPSPQEEVVESNQAAQPNSNVIPVSPFAPMTSNPVNPPAQPSGGCGCNKRK
jgi:hypothetical protein